MTSTREPARRLLYSIPGVVAHHLVDGHELNLNASGPQTLSLYLVSTPVITESKSVEEDIFLHIELPPELDVAVPATTPVFRQGDNTYVLPRSDLAGEGTFLRITLPGDNKDGSKGDDDVRAEKFGEEGRGKSSQNMSTSSTDIDVFESILAQCTAFSPYSVKTDQSVSGGDKASEVKSNYDSKHPPPPYTLTEQENKSSAGSTVGVGKLLLINENSGNVIGELASGSCIVEDGTIQPGEKTPVSVHISETDGKVNISSCTEPIGGDIETSSYLQPPPGFESSKLVAGSVTVSRFILGASSRLARGMEERTANMKSGCQNISTSSGPPMLNFSARAEPPSAYARAALALTTSARNTTARTTAQIDRFARKIGQTIATPRGNNSTSSNNAVKPGKPPTLLNKSLIAFSTLSDSIAQSTSNMLISTARSAQNVVHSRYSPNSDIAALTESLTNVALVYVDITGVTRRALLTSVVRGMVVGRITQPASNSNSNPPSQQHTNPSTVTLRDDELYVYVPSK